MIKRERLHKYIQNENGVALYVVLLVLIVISLLGLGIMGLAVNNVKMSSNERNHQSAYYIAEAGATKVLSNISKNACTTDFEEQYLNKEIQYDSFKESFGEKPKASITIKPLANETYLLNSEGEIGKSKRTVESTFKINCEEDGKVPIEILSDLAVFSHGEMNLISTVTGNIGTNSTANGSIFIDWGMANYTGVINLAPGANPNNIIDTAYTMSGLKPTFNHMPEARLYTLPDFPNYPEGLPRHPNIYLSGNMKEIINLTEDRFYNEIKLASDTSLTFHLNQDRMIRVKSLELPQGHINITGNGKLTLYIEDQFIMTGSSTINKNEPSDKLSIFYKGAKKLDFANDIRINGSLYTQNSDLNLGGSGAITGHILSGGSTITVGGGANLKSRVILAPSAFVHVKNGTVKGSIICNTFKIDGGGRVIFEDFGEDELIPYYPPTEGSGGSNSLIQIEPIREKG